MEKAPEACTHVFIQNTSKKPPLASAYDGSFRVLRKHIKYFTVDLVSRIDNFSIDRIKAAHLIHPVSDHPSVIRFQPNVTEECDVTPAITLACPSTTPRPAVMDEHSAEVTLNIFGRRIADHLGLENKPLRYCFL